MAIVRRMGLNEYPWVYARDMTWGFDVRSNTFHGPNIAIQQYDCLGSFKGKVIRMDYGSLGLKRSHAPPPKRRLPITLYLSYS